MSFDEVFRIGSFFETLRESGLSFVPERFAIGDVEGLELEVGELLAGGAFFDAAQELLGVDFELAAQPVLVFAFGFDASQHVFGELLIARRQLEIGREAEGFFVGEGDHGVPQGRLGFEQRVGHAADVGRRVENGDVGDADVGPDDARVAGQRQDHQRRGNAAVAHHIGRRLGARKQNAMAQQQALPQQQALVFQILDQVDQAGSRKEGVVAQRNL